MTLIYTVAPPIICPSPNSLPPALESVKVSLPVAVRNATGPPLSMRNVHQRIRCRHDRAILKTYGTGISAVGMVRRVADYILAIRIKSVSAIVTNDRSDAKWVRAIPVRDEHVSVRQRHDAAWRSAPGFAGRHGAIATTGTTSTRSTRETTSTMDYPEFRFSLFPRLNLARDVSVRRTLMRSLYCVARNSGTCAHTEGYVFL